MTTLTLFFILIPLITFILLAINILFAPHKPYQEKNSVFECGYHSFLGQNRTQFSVSFFIFALLFLLFDLEILLVYPYVVSAYCNGIYGLFLMLMFFLMLTLGFAFELGKKVLSIETRQISDLDNIEIKYASITYSHISLYIYLLKIINVLFKPILYVLIVYKNYITSNIVNYGFKSIWIFFKLIRNIKDSMHNLLFISLKNMHTENTRMQAKNLYILITYFLMNYSQHISLNILLLYYLDSCFPMDSYNVVIHDLINTVLLIIFAFYFNIVLVCVYLYINYINLYIKNKCPVLHGIINFHLIFFFIYNLYNTLQLCINLAELISILIPMYYNNGANNGPFGHPGGSTGGGGYPGGGSGGGGYPGGHSGGSTGGGDSDPEQSDKLKSYFDSTFYENIGVKVNKKNEKYNRPLDPVKNEIRLCNDRKKQEQNRNNMDQERENFGYAPLKRTNR